MTINKTLATTISAILCGPLALSAAAAPAPASSANEISEIVVTATRRAENLQDVPIAISAMTGEMLSQLKVQTFDDYVRYLPSVTSASKGPGQNELYMRGLSTTQSGNQIAGGVGSFPNVAVYLDDQSVQLPGRNLDIYAADLERIEVLEGPQGTLYGAGAQAGAVRYITNKPKLNLTEAGFSAGYAVTAHGDPSSNAQAYLNLPLIADKFAVRAVIYNDQRGGYIHNIPGTFSRKPTDGGIVTYFGGVVPTDSVSINNNALVNNAYNPTVYQGMRVSALAQINDDWSLLIQQSFQHLDAEGVYAYAPELGDLNVQQYNPSSNKDRFEDTAWTLTGRIAALKAVYTGGYLVRHSEQVTDYTAYSRGAYAAYYQCNGPAFGTSPTDVCYSPSAVWRDIVRNTHQSHEFRLSTPDDNRLRAIGGLFWEDFKIQDSANFQYGQPEAGFGTLAPLPGTTMFDPSPRVPGDVFFNDITRGYKQKALFGELAYDLIPNQLTVTLGSRFYHMDNYEHGSKNSAYGCRGVDPCTAPPGLSTTLEYVTLADGTHVPLTNTNSGHKNKLNVSWKPAPGVMLYATYSEGFRPGGFNRGQGLLSPSSPLYGKFTVPVSYETDNLKNYELGWKTSWFDRRLQVNGALYEEQWTNVQLTLFDPPLYGNLNFTANGPDYRVRGLESEIILKATEHLTLTSSFAWNKSEQTSAPSLIGSDGQPLSLFPTAGLGSPLGQSPLFQGNLRGRYEFTIGDYHGYWQGAVQHSGKSYASIATAGAFEPPNQPQAAYTTYDASLGIAKDAWEVELYGQNLSDTRAQLYVNGFEYVHLVTPNRPRLIGLRLSYHYRSAGTR